MPQTFGSSVLQQVGNPGYLIMNCLDSTGGGANVSVSFNPTLCTVPQLQVQPLQRVNVAVNGSIFIFQLSDNEPLTLPVQFLDLPYNDSFTNPEPTEGFMTLLSFIRTTLNYYASTFILTTPDGIVENVRYGGGIDSFNEAQGRSQRAQRWTGNLVLWRVLT